MTAFILAELSKWKNEYSHRTLKAIFYSCIVTGIPSLMRPDICFPIFMAVFIWMSMVIGQHEESYSEIKNWIREARLTPWQLINGKVLTIIVVDIFHLTILLPIAILFNSIWGITWNTIIFICLTLIITSIIAAIFEILLKCSNWLEPFIRKLLVFIWFLTITLVPCFRALSPFVWIWRVTLQGINLDMIISLVLNLGFILILAVITRVLIKKEMWKQNEN